VWRFLLFKGKRTRDFAFVSLCYGRSGEEICTGYAMAASGRTQYDYKKKTKKITVDKFCMPVCSGQGWGGVTRLSWLPNMAINEHNLTHKPSRHS